MARRQRNIYKRNDGRYEARFVKDRDRNGKAIYGSVYAKNYSMVIEKLETAKLAAASEKITPGANKEIVVKAVECYLETHKILIKPSTYWVYQGYIKNHIQPYFENLRCDRLSQALMQAFVKEKLDTGLSAAKVRSIFTFLKKGLEGTAEASAFQVCLPKQYSPKIEALSINEQKRLEAAVESSDDTNRVGIILCLYTGIRVGELCGLMWQDIDFDTKKLYIRRTIQRIKCMDNDAKTRITLLSPKSISSQRTIPLPGFLLATLKEHRKKSRSEYILSKDGYAIEPRVMQYRFQQLLKLAMVKPRSFHITRHSFAVRALESGFDIKTLSEILGHSTPIVTLKKYTHVMDEHKRESMESLVAVYSNKNSEHGQKSGQPIAEMPKIHSMAGRFSENNNTFLKSGII